ncbi:unnamed protein product [Lepidochelys olivacea]
MNIDVHVSFCCLVFVSLQALLESDYPGEIWLHFASGKENISCWGSRSPAVSSQPGFFERADPSGCSVALMASALSWLTLLYISSTFLTGTFSMSADCNMDCQTCCLIDCNKGHYYTAGNCLECPVGFYCPGGRAAPRKCPVGTANQLTAQADITACQLLARMAILAQRPDQGVVCAQTAICVIHTVVFRRVAILVSTHLRESWSVGSVPKDTSALMDETDRHCSAGQEPNPSRTHCVTCTLGSFSTKEALGCQPCPAVILALGHYCPHIGTIQPLLCPPGSCTDAPGQSECQKCNESSCCLDTVSQIQKDREPVESPEDLQCPPCPSGHFCADGFTAPPCPAGSFEPREQFYRPSDSSSCLPAGIYMFGLSIYWGIRQCLKCPTGYFCPAGARYPRPCRAGTYNPLRGQDDATDCRACPAGRVCTQAGLTQPDSECMAGFMCVRWGLPGLMLRATRALQAHSATISTFLISLSVKHVLPDSSVREEQGGSRSPLSHVQLVTTAPQAQNIQHNTSVPQAPGAIGQAWHQRRSVCPVLKAGFVWQELVCRQGDATLDITAQMVHGQAPSSPVLREPTVPDWEMAEWKTALPALWDPTAQMGPPSQLFAQSQGLLSSITGGTFPTSSGYEELIARSKEQRWLETASPAPEDTTALSLALWLPKHVVLAAFQDPGSASCLSCLTGHYCADEITSREAMLLVMVCPEGLLCPKGQAVAPDASGNACPRGYYCPRGDIVRGSIWLLLFTILSSFGLCFLGS